ncbi:anhydro-N-acetylmuramic acid kinase [Rhodovulum sp. DZ06]|uniref:anhydro-N-acetylmuramic acid kinase n=1 Tax=Rhodovulum sp. DZ06 TaxID=3425126 RepID=UPI003D34FB59
MEGVTEALREAFESGPDWCLGLMSGTAMDGVDAALVLTDGEEITGFGPSLFSAYPKGSMAAARSVHADGLRLRAGGDPALVAAAGAEVDAAHAAACAALLAAPAAPDAALVGYHGQTVAHAPDEGWTWQLGDGAALAKALRRPVAWDFRSADMTAGGQGAPLAPFFHWALARRIGAPGPVAFLNLGGVGNVTWADPQADGPEAPGALLAFDTGPANAPVDDWMRRQAGLPHDPDGRHAAAGKVHEGVFKANSVRAYLGRRPPKSLDRNDFAQAAASAEGLSLEDGAATLTALSARMAAAAQDHFPAPVSRWLVCGGGRRNAALMAMLAERVEAPVQAVEEAGLDGDMLEAQCFAWLAARVVRGLPLSAPGTTGVAGPTPGGRLARP